MTLFDRFRRKNRLLAAYHGAFDSEDGRIVLMDLARKYGVLHSIYSPAPDGMARALDMAHADGARNVILGIIRTLAIQMDDLIAEAQHEETRTRERNYYDDSTQHYDT